MRLSFTTVLLGLLLSTTRCSVLAVPPSRFARCQPSEEKALCLEDHLEEQQHAAAPSPFARPSAQQSPFNKDQPEPLLDFYHFYRPPYNKQVLHAGGRPDGSAKSHRHRHRPTYPVIVGFEPVPAESSSSFSSSSGYGDSTSIAGSSLPRAASSPSFTTTTPTTTTSSNTAAEHTVPRYGMLERELSLEWIREAPRPALEPARHRPYSSSQDEVSAPIAPLPHRKYHYRKLHYRPLPVPKQPSSEQNNE